MNTRQTQLLKLVCYISVLVLLEPEEKLVVYELLSWI